MNIIEYSDTDLLELKFKDLPLKIKGSNLEKCIERLYTEIRLKGITFCPPCYIGDEWFSPGEIGAIAIPFYLFSPRLMALEKKIMKVAEGDGMNLVRT